MLHRICTLVVALLVGAVVALPAHGSSAVAAPPGWRVEAEQVPAPGVVVTRLVRDAGPVVAHVVRAPVDGEYRLRAVLSADRGRGVEGPRRERTSSVCRRVACVVAVNGDFAVPGLDVPVGGLVSDGVLHRSPTGTHHQFAVTGDGGFRTGTLGWRGRVVDSSLAEVALAAVNAERRDDEVVLYTPAFGPSTGTNQHGAELVLRRSSTAPFPVAGSTAVVEVVELRDGMGDAPIPPDGAVLSGHGAGAAAVRALWARVQEGVATSRVLLRVETDPAVRETLGGSHVLVRDGAVWVGDDGSTFVAGRHPRTIVGWTADGHVLLVTIDGRQPGYSVGMALPEAAALLVALGADEALNIDGGGSTTLVARGEVVNRPSDALVRRAGEERVVPAPGRRDVLVGRVERPVASVLALVAASPGPTLALPDTSLVVDVPSDAPVAAQDPASFPDGGGLPALVAIAPAADDGRGLGDGVLVLVAVLLQLVVVGALVRRAR